MNDYVGIAAIIGATGTVVTPIVVAVLTRRQNLKIEEVHKATNGMSERNEAIARKLGVEEGKATEKANPS